MDVRGSYGGPEPRPAASPGHAGRAESRTASPYLAQPADRARPGGAGLHAGAGRGNPAHVRGDGAWSLCPPRFESIGGAFFEVTLRNEPVYDQATIDWLERFKSADLSGDQTRLLAFARAHGGRFTSRDYQRLVELDLYGASNSIKDLVRRGIVRSLGKRSRIYDLVLDTAVSSVPEELTLLLPLLRTKGAIRNSDAREVLGMSYKSASRLLDRLTSEGWLDRVGERRGTHYVAGSQRYGMDSL